MKNLNRSFSFLLLIIVIASAVFYIGNFDILSNKYLVNDDVRQQIFWMERWRDPQLFQNDFLTNYAQTYVPIGVKALYWIASFRFDPLIFSNILTFMLFVVTAALWFQWGKIFGDNLTAFLLVIAYFLFTGFQYQMSGGLSRSFVLPLMILYLLLVSQEKLFLSGLVILAQPFFNPYVFLLCLCSHGIMMLTKFGPALVTKIFPNFCNVPGIGSYEKQTQKTAIGILKELLVLNIPVIGGVVFTIASVIWYQSSTGHLISWTEMIGRSEYSELGRYQLYPEPSFFYELVRPWVFNLSFPYWGPIAGWIMVIIVMGVFAYATWNYQSVVKWKGLRGLIFLIVASLLLYILARCLLVKLFVPRRYLNYTLNIVYCIGLAVALRIIFEKIKLNGLRLYAIVLALLVFACYKGRHIEIFDYSSDLNLYKFVETTPKNALIAGWPETMDDVMTFGKRRAFVTYKLSHTWVEPFWNQVKKRTFDFFKAYYSSDPGQIRRFCKANHIDYFIVRLKDFEPEQLKKTDPYFEPFNGFIWYLTNSKSYFAVLDKETFPPLFEDKGIRVLQIK